MNHWVNGLTALSFVVSLIPFVTAPSASQKNFSITAGQHRSAPIFLAQAPSTNLPIGNLSKVSFLTGTWEGTYTCGQGLTSLRLVIDAQSPTEISAVFIFSPHPSNPNIPSGSFEMTGTYRTFDSPDVPGVLELEGVNWLNQPSGWSMVNLTGNVSAADDEIRGNVVPLQGGTGCTTFEVTRRR
jgi:hypothetical protein